MEDRMMLQKMSLVLLLAMTLVVLPPTFSSRAMIRFMLLLPREDIREVMVEELRAQASFVMAMDAGVSVSGEIVATWFVVWWAQT